MRPNKDIRVAVGLSGGVDSAVTAALLVERGYDVVGLTMKVYDTGVPVVEGAKHACYGPGELEDLEECERLCARLGIPYTVIDLRREYRDRVLDYFRDEYLRGRTPNPCVRCNHELKFGFMLSRARETGLDFDFFATGHYARIDRALAYPRLRVASFAAKDQTYFLHRLPRAILEKALFPLGDMSKAQVREAARALGLEMAEKPESQDFIAGGDYSTVFSGQGSEPGDIVDLSGKVLGRHRGIVHYTIGQRRGLGVSGPLDSGGNPEPVYVARIDSALNRVILAPDTGLFADGLEASSCVFNLGDSDPETGLLPEGRAFRVRARIRQNHPPAPAELETLPGGRMRVRFDAPVRAIAPGQSAALYDEEGFVLGGGIIDSGFRSD